jgi:hypothetical protein
MLYFKVILFIKNKEMLNFIISILEKLLISLKNIQSNSTENMTVDVTKKTGSKK